MLTLLAVLAIFVPQQPLPNYEEAFSQAIQEKRPLLVIVSAKWCGACQVLKRDTILPMCRDRELRDAVVVVVDVDEDPENAKKLMAGEKLPQIVLFNRRTGEKWKRFRMEGRQTREKIKELFDRAMK